MNVFADCKVKKRKSEKRRVGVCPGAWEFLPCAGGDSPTASGPPSLSGRVFGARGGISGRVGIPALRRGRLTHRKRSPSLSGRVFEGGKLFVLPIASDLEPSFIRNRIKPFRFHAFNADIRIAVDFRDDVVDLLLRSLNFHDDGSVVLVLYPSRHALALGCLLRFIAESDRLHTSEKTDMFSLKVIFFFQLAHILNDSANNKTDRESLPVLLLFGANSDTDCHRSEHFINRYLLIFSLCRKERIFSFLSVRLIPVPAFQRAFLPAPQGWRLPFRRRDRSPG